MAHFVKEVSTDLHNTVEQIEQIEEIYFTADGHHYFNRHEFIERVQVKRGAQTSWGDKKSGEFYGSVLSEVKTEETTLPNGKTTTRSFMAQKRNPAALIVDTLTREELLDLPTFEFDHPAAVKVNALPTQVRIEAKPGPGRPRKTETEKLK